jgi:hypothetical protein
MDDEIIEKSETESFQKESISISIGGDENVSLQDAFSKFREAKARERKLLKAYKENSLGERTDQFKE